MEAWKNEIARPLVSIQCLTYNHEGYISDAINGFLIQKTDFPFEIIIHDDASTDLTAGIIRQYALKYPRLIKPIYQKENQFSQGKKQTIRNAIDELIEGKYIALCEGDDYWTDPLKLQKQVNFLESNQEYSACYTGATLINEKGVVLNENKHFGDSSEDELISGNGTAITCSIMFKRIPLQEYISLNISSFDIFLWHLLGFYGKCKYLDSIENSVYRIHSAGVWNGKRLRDQLPNSIYVYSLIRERIIKKCPQNKFKLLQMHDHLYNSLFSKFFVESIKNGELQNIIFGVKELHKLKYVKKYNIYIFTMKNFLRDCIKSKKKIDINQDRKIIR